MPPEESTPDRPEQAPPPTDGASAPGGDVAEGADADRRRFERPAPEAPPTPAGRAGVAAEPRWSAPDEAPRPATQPHPTPEHQQARQPHAVQQDSAPRVHGAASRARPAGIEVVDVRRAFGAVHAVRSMTFTAAPGSVTALIGPNGAGKTTLMLMLASLLAPDAGSIRVGGIDPIAEPRAARRVLGWMPDVLGTWRTLTPRTVLRMVGRLHGLPAPVARQRADELVVLLDLEQLADRPSRVLSRGQQQRLGLARALVHHPSVLLLDEPAAGLDPASRLRLRGMLRDLADAGATVLVSSHDLGELDEVADASVFVEHGEVVSGERIASARGTSATWRVRALDPAALSLAIARIGVAIDRVRVEGDATTIVVDRDEDAADLLARLVAQGVPVVHFAPTVGTIERTFLGLHGEADGPGRQRTRGAGR